jgi:beta-lactamase regulating signal transducer with metallopeptidase domain
MIVVPTFSVPMISGPMISAHVIAGQVISALPAAALRSLALAIGVWMILRVFRVRNVLALKSAWTLVLAAAFLMPLLLPIAARLPRATLVLPAFMQQSASVTPALPPEQTVTARDPRPIVPPTSHRSGNFAAARPHSADSSAPVPADLSVRPAPISSSSSPAPQALSIFAAAALLYLAISGLLLMRLIYGLIRAFILWRCARPVSAKLAAAHGLQVRASAAVSSPVTIGSTVVLPADYMAWDSEKLRIVLAHERSHIRQGDFYLQALAGLYAAIVWISPLGWWLKRQLSDLAEAISDRSGLEEAASRATYARILLEFAAAPRPTLIGVAMARSSNLSHRIERLFNDGAFRQAFTASRRTLATALLVPVFLFAATTLVRVEAAAQTPQATPGQSQTPITGQSNPDSVQPAATADAAPAQVAAPVPPQAAPTPAPSPAPAPAPSASAPATHIEVPAIHVKVPAVHVNVQAQHIEVPAIHVDVPAKHIDIPARHIDVPAVHVDMPAHSIDIKATHIDIPARQIDIPARHIDIPAIHIDIPPSPAPTSFDSRPAPRAGGELLAMLDGFGHGLFLSAKAGPTEATFDRTLTFSGKLDLRVANAAGSIHFTRGSSDQIRIQGRVHSQDPDEANEVSSIAANPPIEQNGNMIHIGLEQQQGTNHIVIDYDIEAPADASVAAASGSGNISDEGVGQDPRFSTGSGNISATGIQGGFKLMTGSGSIAVENTGEGDAKVQTGSGRIEAKGIHGALDAQTGSGSIKAEGTPSAPWKLQTGTGSIDLVIGNAPITLDASVGSGSISASQPMATQASNDKHHVHAQINGGGPEVRVETGSGSIHVQ